MTLEVKTAKLVRLTNVKFVLRTFGYKGGKRKKRLVVTGLKPNGIRVYTSECVKLVDDILETRNGRLWQIDGDIT